MANAATELASILAGWSSKPNGQTMYTARGSTGGGTSSFWEQHLHAAALLLAVKGLIDDLEASGEDDVDGYRSAFPDWSRAVFAPDMQWNATNTQGTLLSITSLALLKSLGHVVKREPLLPPVTAQTRANIRSSLDTIVDSLADEEMPLTSDQKAYVLRLVNAIRRLLEDVTVVGTADLFDHINQLIGFLLVMSSTYQDVNPTWSEKVKDAAWRIVPWVALAGRIGLAMLDGSADVHELMPPAI